MKSESSWAAKITMRTPFQSHQISKLPKPTKQQTDEVRADFKKGIRCLVCGGWHHPNVVHLDYVGHAALTDRLLDIDPEWNWEPLSLDEKGLPRLDNDGGLWIRLTVLGVTRLGYGDAQGKTGGDAMKERIGDALRNAAMRFGAALDLWHKGDLHIEDAETKKVEKPVKQWPDDKFNERILTLKQSVLSGQRTTKEVKELLLKKGALSENQLNEIDSWDDILEEIKNG